MSARAHLRRRLGSLWVGSTSDNAGRRGRIAKRDRGATRWHPPAAPCRCVDWDETEAAPYASAPGLGWLHRWYCGLYVEHPVLRTRCPAREDNDSACAAMSKPARATRTCAQYRAGCRRLRLHLRNDSVDRHRVVMVRRRRSRAACRAQRGTWKAEPAEVATWGRRVPDDNAPLELRARHAFAVITDLAAKALEHRLPMKLDF